MSVGHLVHVLLIVYNSTEHAVEENHDWDSAEVVAREAPRQTRWIK